MLHNRLRSEQLPLNALEAVARRERIFGGAAMQYKGRKRKRRPFGPPFRWFGIAPSGEGKRERQGASAQGRGETDSLLEDRHGLLLLNDSGFPSSQMQLSKVSNFRNAKSNKLECNFCNWCCDALSAGFSAASHLDTRGLRY